MEPSTTEEASISAKYTIRRKCIQCGQVYKEIDNIGHLGCRIHPGIRLCDHNNREFYSCCGLYIDTYQKGYITYPFLLGCVSLDHMDRVPISDAPRLTTTKLDTRLNELKAFAIIIIPRAILNIPGVIPPKRETILMDFNGFSGMSLSPTLDHHLSVFSEIRHHHEQLFPQHDPYTDRLYCRQRIEIEPVLDEFAIKKRDTLVINVHDTARQLDRSRAASTGVRTRGVTNNYREGWAVVKKEAEEDDDMSGVAHVARKKEAVPFMIIRRIDDKLNIHPVHSKFSTQ